MADFGLASQIKQFDAAVPLANAARIKGAEQEFAINQYKQQQVVLGDEARGLQAYVGTPEFPQKWAEAADRLKDRGVLDERSHAQWRSSPSPLALKAIIQRTSDPALQLQRENMDRQQANADRAFTEQKRQFDITSRGKPTTEKLKNADGSESLIRVNPDNTTTTIAESGGGPGQANPYAPAGKQTEGQANASLYASRMFEAEQILRDPKIVEAATSASERAIEGAPNTLFGLNVGLGAAKNALHSKEFQKFYQAQRNFINATLRRESGAVISDAEFDNAREQYFPQLGDSKEVLAQKQANRQEAIKGIAGAGGPNYTPPFTFEADGSMKPYTRPAAAKKAAATNSGALDRAREAIAKGAPRDAVIKRLQDNGIDPSGL